MASTWTEKRPAMASETPDIPETQAEKAAAWDALLSAGARVHGEPHYGAEAAERIVEYMRIFKVDWRDHQPKPPAVTFKHYALDGWGWEDGAGNCQTGLPTREAAISARKHFEATGHFDYQPNTHLCADACPECGGTGEWAGLSGMPMHPCRDCGGTGRR